MTKTGGCNLPELGYTQYKHNPCLKKEEKKSVSVLSVCQINHLALYQTIPGAD